jgi:hypothetical protein
VKTRIIKDTGFERVAEGVKPDAKKRVVLSGARLSEGVTYHVYVNSLGQIVLDPQVTIPASEAWLFKDPEALGAVRRGLADADAGKVSKVALDKL